MQAKTRTIWKKSQRRQKWCKFWRRNGYYITAAALAAVVFAGVAVAATVLTEAEKQLDTEKTLAATPTEAPEPTTEPQTQPETTQAPQEYPPPFNQMSQDWSGDDVLGWVPYNMPQEYAENGGYFPEIMQKYTYIVCNNNGVDYAVVLGLIEVESGYRYFAESEGGAKGYMQVIESWHEDRMERVSAYDLLNPFQNVSTGVDFLAELVDKYDGNYQKALTAYRWGATGAYRDYFSKGQQSCTYAEAVLEAAERIRKQMGGAEQ
ncbi:MAG: transglycosylase SLT domain-containing protein [Lachnospiraceae bacterium]|nr:transglycosylase SLT domain-containing protein [Lachnospiraceae bacterium]